MKKYTTWLLTASVFQLIAALMHATTLFGNVPPNNETEKQMFTLMDTYQFDFGAGFHPTMGNLLLALSACFSLVYSLGGLLNWFLLRKKISSEIMRGVININLLIFGVTFALFATFTFLVPIVLAGMVLLFLILSRLTIAGSSG